MTTTDPAGANGTKPRGRDAARTREMVLAGAMAEFTAKGFAGARIDAVAERAGVNVRAIYQHFESKAALFDAVVGAGGDVGGPCTGGRSPSSTPPASAARSRPVWTATCC